MKRGRPKPSMCENQPAFIEAPTRSKTFEKKSAFPFFYLCQLQEFGNVSPVT